MRRQIVIKQEIRTDETGKHCVLGCDNLRNYAFAKLTCVMFGKLDGTLDHVVRHPRCIESEVGK
jgi:hypothetical protein